MRIGGPPVVDRLTPHMQPMFVAVVGAQTMVEPVGIATVTGLIVDAAGVSDGNGAAGALVAEVMFWRFLTMGFSGLRGSPSFRASLLSSASTMGPSVATG
jgi:hypothetical protein